MGKTKTPVDGPFSKAMLNYQRVAVMQKQVSGMLIFCKVPWSARVDVASQAWDGWLAMALDGHCISLHD